MKKSEVIINAVKDVDVEEVYLLRYKVLRPQQSIEDCAYPGDKEKSTKHFAVSNESNHLVGIASLYYEAKEIGGHRFHWRLRGMATDESVRGQGLGQKLLQACIAHAQKQKDGGLWCNARTPACGFYEKNGLKKVGEEFEIIPIGPHYVMVIS